MSHRREQLTATLRRTIGQVIEEGLSDPRIRGLISVTEVTITPDGSRAIVQVSVLPEEGAELTMHGLRHAAGHIGGQVSERVRIRHMPRLDFRLDSSLKTQARVLEAIRDAVGDPEAAVSDGTDDPESDRRASPPDSSDDAGRQ